MRLGCIQDGARPMRFFQDLLSTYELLDSADENIAQFDDQPPLGLAPRMPKCINASGPGYVGDDIAPTVSGMDDSPDGLPVELWNDGNNLSQAPHLSIKTRCTPSADT